MMCICKNIFECKKRDMFAYIRSFFVDASTASKKIVNIKPNVPYGGKVTLVTGSTNDKLSTFMKNSSMDWSVLVTDLALHGENDSGRVVQWDSDAIFEIDSSKEKGILVNTLDVSKVLSNELAELIERTRKSSGTLVLQCPLERVPSSIVADFDQIVFATPARRIPFSDRLRFHHLLFGQKKAFDIFMKDWGSALHDDSFYLVPVELPVSAITKESE